MGSTRQGHLAAIRTPPEMVLSKADYSLSQREWPLTILEP